MGDLQSDKRIMQMMAKEQQQTKEYEPMHIKISAADMISKMEQLLSEEGKDEK
jgi:hypothetical protein